MSGNGRTVDRRVERTRKVLLDSLRLLMMERGYERMTIQNILDHADVGRATFYAHFSSKDQLLEESIAGLRGWLLQQAPTHPPRPLGFSFPFFAHLDSHRGIYRMTVGRRGEVTVGRMIRRMLRELIRDDLESRPGPPGSRPPTELMTEYIVGALWSTVVWWMTSETALPSEEVDRVFRDLVFTGLPATIGDTR
jgi:AcrR family transcriptional regulator